MNNPKKISLSTEALNKQITGVNALADAVKVTLGPKGKTVIIEKSYGSPIITKDGVTVAKEIHLENKEHNLGAQVIKEAAAKTGESVGDGTTTATVLTQAILQEGMKALNAGHSSVDLRKGLYKALDICLNKLNQIVIPCSSQDSICHVATISANGDKKIGNIITDALQAVGKYGTVTVADSKGFEDELEVVEGLRIDRGYISHYFVPEGSQRVDLENAYIMLCDKKITSMRDVIPVMEKCAKESRQLVVVAEDVTDEALQTLIINNMRGVVKVVAVKAPGFGDRRKELLDDIGVLTGATTISEEVGSFSDPDTFLGFAAKIQIRKNDTTFIRGNSNKESLEKRIQMIQEQLDDSTNSYEKEQYQERIAKLSEGVAVIRVGGATEVEIAEKKYRIDDALQATKAAVEEGIVAGGGITLLAMQESLAQLQGESEGEKYGIQILSRALEYPIKQILLNAGIGPDVIIEKIQLNREDNFGFNAATMQYGNLIEMGIVDPKKVTRCAVQTAVSVASLLLNTDCLITNAHSERNTTGNRGMENNSMPM